MKLSHFLKKTLYRITAAFLLLVPLVFNSGCIDDHVARNIPFEYKCKYNAYSVDLPHDSFLCSEGTISKHELNTFDIFVEKFSHTYPEFISSWGYDWSSFLKEERVIVLTKSEMNDSKIFGIDDPVAARYFPSYHVMYITKLSLNLDNLDIPHELAHVADADLQILDEDLDERIAYSFEDFYSRYAE